MLTFLAIAAIVAIAYQLAALAAVLLHASRSRSAIHHSPPVTILKPVRGLDVDFDLAIESHAVQDYPDFEILFGVHSLDDPAVPHILRLIERHPDKSIRLVHCTTEAANAKVGVLVDLARQARHEILLVNDSDISVPPDYLQRVVAPLGDPRTGLVTCVYRAVASSFAGKWEALGISVDFIPSTLVAPMVGIREFGLGSTLVFRRTDLAAIGGFEAVADYIADDYQLSKRITATGKHAHMSEVVVETHLSDPDWTAVWRHQIRWARTIRVSRGDGYSGLPVTHAGLWALLCALGGAPSLMALIMIARVLMAIAAGIVLRDRRAVVFSWLALLWDLWAFCVWIAGWSGSVIEWRGGRMSLTADGRMVPLKSRHGSDGGDPEAATTAEEPDVSRSSVN